MCRQSLELVRKAWALAFSADVALEALTVALQHGHVEAEKLLATHLARPACLYEKAPKVVELSYGMPYLRGDYEKAIGCYREAIGLCEEHGGA